MLPANYVRGIRRLQLFTLAQQLRRVSAQKLELEELDRLTNDNFRQW